MGTPKASVFLCGVHERRRWRTRREAITFAFNGGPGADRCGCMGALGRGRVEMGDVGNLLAPPQNLLITSFDSGCDGYRVYRSGDDGIHRPVPERRTSISWRARGCAVGGRFHPVVGDAEPEMGFAEISSRESYGRRARRFERVFCSSVRNVFDGLF